MKACYWVLGTSLGTSLIGALGFTKGIGGLDNGSRLSGINIDAALHSLGGCGHLLPTPIFPAQSRELHVKEIGTTDSFPFTAAIQTIACMAKENILPSCMELNREAEQNIFRMTEGNLMPSCMKHNDSGADIFPV